MKKSEEAFTRDALEYILVQLHKLGVSPLEDAIQYFSSKAEDTAGNLSAGARKPYLEFSESLTKILGHLSSVDSNTPVQ